MSLIMGVNLPDKLFIATDTRLTHKSEAGNIYQDNFLKTFSFAGKVTVAAAGSARLASFIIQKLGKSDITKNGITFLRDKIEEFLPKVLDEYLSAGGKYEKTVLIFGGFDADGKKSINSSMFGDFQSRGILGKKGVVNQSINRKVLSGLMKEFIKRDMGQIPKDTKFEIDSPNSSVFSVEIVLPNKPSFKDVDCYKFVVYGPRGLTEQGIPDDILQKFEVEINSDLSGEQMVAQWSVELVALIKSVAKEYYLETVGGNVVTLLLTPNGAVLPSGRVMFYDNETRQTNIVSEILESGGKLCTRDDQGIITPFEQIMDFNKEGGFEI